MEAESGVKIASLSSAGRFPRGHRRSFEIWQGELRLRERGIGSNLKKKKRPERHLDQDCIFYSRNMKPSHSAPLAWPNSGGRGKQGQGFLQTELDTPEKARLNT